MTQQYDDGAASAVANAVRFGIPGFRAAALPEQAPKVIPAAVAMPGADDGAASAVANAVRFGIPGFRAASPSVPSAPKVIPAAVAMPGADDGAASAVPVVDYAAYASAVAAYVPPRNAAPPAAPLIDVAGTPNGAIRAEGEAARKRMADANAFEDGVRKRAFAANSSGGKV